MERLLIQIPAPLKAKLDALRTQGYTISGFIRAVLERELAEVPEAPCPTSKRKTPRARLTGPRA